MRRLEFPLILLKSERKEVPVRGSFFRTFWDIHDDVLYKRVLPDDAGEKV